MYRRIQTRNPSLNGSKRRSCVGRSSWLFLHRSDYDNCACLYCKVDGRNAVTIYLFKLDSKVLPATATYGYMLTKWGGGDDSALLH